MTSQQGRPAGNARLQRCRASQLQLEVAEAILHCSAEESPDRSTTTRLHALGDEVTAQAHAIDRRANLLTGPCVEPSGETNRRMQRPRTDDGPGDVLAEEAWPGPG